jgi:prolyl oligopeptidase
VLQLRDLKTGHLLHTFKLDIGCVAGFSGHLKHTELFFKFASQITPGTIYHVDLSPNGGGGATSQPVPKVHITTKVHNFNPEDFTVKQVFYPSKDGTQVPMFIITRRDFVPDGSSPCLLYGYGGFNISLTPNFNLIHTFFVQHFGIAAVANIRGGGEYGEAWQNAGRQENLQNILTDFQCAAEYLIREQYTTPAKLTINGGSHGGMLVGACVNQRPDLYGAGVNVVGVMDLLRFHKFTVGYAWVSNYGCSDNEKDFK